MNIYEKLIEVRKAVPYLKKDNQGNQYSYVSSSQTLGSLKSKMDELKLLLIPAVKDHGVHMDTVEYKDHNGKLKRTTTYFTELVVEFTWLNAEKPDEKIVCSWYGQGVDIAGEKGVGKALTYAEKYFMLKFFNIPTDKDDPDKFQKKFDEEHEQPAKQQKKPPADAISKAQLDRLFAIANSSGVSPEEAKEIIHGFGYESSKHIKKSDYENIITAIEMAGKHE